LLGGACAGSERGECSCGGHFRMRIICDIVTSYTIERCALCATLSLMSDITWSLDRGQTAVNYSRKMGIFSGLKSQNVSCARPNHGGPREGGLGLSASQHTNPYLPKKHPELAAFGSRTP